jgi:ubiquinol-cytochrome c reductase cytochrome b subunit
MANEAAYKPGFWGWLNRRLPVEVFWRSQLSEYYAPKNFNFWYFFGSLAMLVLVMQLVTGIFLAMFYKVGENTAFDSVEFIMREVDFGWLLRYLHSTGASAFFLVIYLHMFRGIMYGSYKSPRELLWLFGMIIYLALMAEAFMGYVLPWGNMSFWAATVIINIFGAIPVIGPRRLRHRRCHAEPLFLPACRGAAAAAAVAGGAAPGRIARGGFQQS